MTVWKAEQFWTYSLAFYGDKNVQTCCLELQDLYGFNVNLLLLCCYLNQAEYQLYKPDFEALKNSIADTESRLSLQRNVRRKAKGTAKYKYQLELELTLEKAQQIDLINALNNQHIKQGSSNNLMKYAYQQKSKSLTSVQTQLLEQLNHLAINFANTQESGQ